MFAKRKRRKLRSSKLFERSKPSYTPIPYDGGESTSIPPVSPSQDASSTTATVPRPSIANRHVNRRLHMYANRKLRSSKLFERSGPSYTPYHMVAESRPLYLLFRLVRTPLRLRRRYHAHPLPTGTPIVVYICMPIANYAAASCLNDWGLPTHHTIWWRRVDLCPLYLLFRLVRTPLRLRRRYHAHPLPTGTSIVVYICMPNANYAAASCLNDRGLPTHHTI